MMMTSADSSPGNSRTVQSNQVDTHPHLLTILQRRKGRAFSAPIKKHTKEAFYSLLPRLEHTDRLILDAGCGTGYSSIQLARRFPSHTVIGIDRSMHRLERGRQHQLLEQAMIPEMTLPDNVHFLRADCIDFWRLSHEEGLHFDRLYLLYPNPYPKKKHVRRRWHAHPVFPTLLSSCRTLTLRTNWELYAKEFVLAVEYLTGSKAAVDTLETNEQDALSLFEKKYLASGHQLFEVSLTLQ